MRYEKEWVAMRFYGTRLTPTQARIAKRLGDGNLSEGIRRCIDACGKDKSKVDNNKK